MVKGWRLLDRKATEAWAVPPDERVVLHTADSGQRYAFTNESGLYKLIADKYGPDVRVMSLMKSRGLWRTGTSQTPC